MCGALAAPASAAGQLAGLPLSLELGAGAAIPTGDWSVAGRDASLGVGPGPAFSGGLRFALPAGFSLYAAYHRTRPRCEDCELAGLAERLLDQGAGFGIGYALPELLPVALRFDAGLIGHQIAFSGGGERRPSETGWGGEAGLAASFGLRPSLFVEPSLLVRAFSARYEFEDDSVRELRVRYLLPRVGLRYRF